MSRQKSDTFRIAFIPSANSGVVYWRIWNIAKALRKIPGVEAAVFAWQSNMVNAHPWQEDCYTNKRVRVEIEDLVRCADVIVFQTVCTPMALSIIEAVKQIHKKPILCEIDDYVINIPTYNDGSRAYFANSDLEHFAISQMKLSDGVIVTTPYLKKVYSEYNDNIYIVPNSIDFKHWNVPVKKHTGLRIGWIGGGTHSQDIAMVWPALKRVIDKYRAKGKDIKFSCVHGVPNFLKDDKYKDKVLTTSKWSHILEYPQFMASFGFDIGIAPLLENSFNLAKSNLRWLEYSALRIPSVCSNLGHFTDTIENGKTAFLADSEGDWIDGLSELIENPDTYQAMSTAAYNSVYEKFNITNTAAAFLESMKALAAGRKKEEATV